MRLMKTHFRLLFLLLALLVSSSVQAAPTVGFVDVVKVTRDAPQMKAVEKTLEEEFVLREQKIIEMRDQIAALQEKLDKEKRSMGTDERRRLERDIKSRELRYSTGVGLSWMSPVGPLTLSYAKGLKEDSQDELESFQFTLGTVF